MADRRTHLRTLDRPDAAVRGAITLGCHGGGRPSSARTAMEGLDRS
jgi:hypothetical protein